MDERVARRRRAVERSKVAGHRQEKGLTVVPECLSLRLSREAERKCSLCGGEMALPYTRAGERFYRCGRCFPPGA